MEAPDWPAEETDSDATLTVTLTLTLTGGSSSDFLDVDEVVVAGLGGLLITESALILVAGAGVTDMADGVGGATWFALSVVQFVVAAGGIALAEVEGEWEGLREGEGEGEIDGEGEVWGASNGMVIHAWFRMSSSWGLLWGRTFRHCLMISWHSVKAKKREKNVSMFCLKLISYLYSKWKQKMEKEKGSSGTSDSKKWQQGKKYAFLDVFVAMQMCNAVYVACSL